MMSENKYEIHMEACRLMVIIQAKIDNEEIAEKINLNTTLKELAEISLKLGFRWEIRKR